jgi:phosphatidyl-myo-inositol dimannoside synthase
VCFGDAPQRRPANDASAVHAGSRAGTVRAVLAAPGKYSHVLVWHIGMLKLVPLVRLHQGTVVLFLHGIEAWRRQSLLTRLLLRRVGLFLSVTEFTWNRFVRANPSQAGKRHSITALGEGMPWEGSTPTPSATPAALMLSRLARTENYKGHREMLDAWPLVLEQVPNAELWIAGDGDLLPAFQQLARHRGLGSAVRFLGHVTEEHKQELIAQARCMALPSRGEGFGLVYIEGMRLGRPCLVTMLDGGHEVVDPPHCGLAADPGDRRQLAAAVCRLLATGSEWHAWSRAARARYESAYTERHFQERICTALGLTPVDA